MSRKIKPPVRIYAERIRNTPSQRLKNKARRVPTRAPLPDLHPSAFTATTTSARRSPVFFLTVRTQPSDYSNPVRLFDWLFGKAATAPTDPLVKGLEVPDEALVLPLRNAVMFPGGVLPVSIGRALFPLLDEALARRDNLLLLVTQRSLELESPGPADLFEVGTLCRITQVGPREAEQQAITVQGLARVRARWYAQIEMPLLAKVEAFETENSGFDGVQEATDTLRAVTRKLLARMPEMPRGANELLDSIALPTHLTDLVIANVEMPLADKQRALETSDLRTRISVVTALLTAKLAATGPLLKVVPND